MSIGNILLLENEELLQQQLVAQLHQRECEVSVVSSLAAAEECLAENSFDLVLAETLLPDGTARDLLPRLRPHAAAMPVVVISEFGAVESAVDCLREGAFGYLLKPFSRAQVEVVLGQVETHLRLVQLSLLPSREAEADGGWALLGDSPAIRQLRQTIRQVARTEATVLITGDSGTGKRRIAHALYRQSARAQAPLVRADCAGLPPARLETDLFGRERDAEGLGGRHGPGRLELADGGTLLLEEISALPPELQGRLLRVLQEQIVVRAGASRGRRVNVRVLATTRHPLDELVQRGQFREDLYLRLNLVPVVVPPLRDHKEDLPLLAEHFRHGCARKHASSVLALSPECLQALTQYAWPGNTRELRHVIERAVRACGAGNIVEPIHLNSAIVPVPAAAPVAPVGPAMPDDLGEVEQQHILAVLDKCRGNRTHAAQRLGISIRTLRNKLKEYRLAQTGGTAAPPD